MSKKVCLISGITGQDGSYLAELLLAKEYEVHGIVRRSSTCNTERIDNIFKPEDKKYLHYGDLQEGFDKLLYEIQPDLFFNTAAMSHVRISFDVPIYTMDVNATGVVRILEGIKKLGLIKKTRILQCASSEMFGITLPPQDENTPFHPVSTYGIAKLAAYWAIRAYRDGYGIFACNSICFNHEGQRRGINFVTRKITRGAVRIKLGLQKDLVLGNLDAMRDWGNAKDYTRAMIMILENDYPDDWVISTGEYHTVKEFVIKVFDYFDLDWEKYVKYDKIFLRPNEVPALLGKSDKIREKLGWKPEIDFAGLVKEMCDNDYKIEKSLI